MFPRNGFILYRQVISSPTKLPTGVTLLPNGKYRALIGVGQHKKHLGCFDTVEAASEKYEVAKRLRDLKYRE